MFCLIFEPRFFIITFQRPSFFWPVSLFCSVRYLSSWQSMDSFWCYLHEHSILTKIKSKEKAWYTIFMLRVFSLDILPVQKEHQNTDLVKNNDLPMKTVRCFISWYKVLIWKIFDRKNSMYEVVKKFGWEPNKHVKKSEIRNNLQMLLVYLEKFKWSKNCLDKRL